MHRQSNAFRGAVDQPQQQQISPPISIRKMEGPTDHLPLYDVDKREITNSREKSLHLIPLFVMLCFFILWWFSYPVNLETNNGRIATAYRVMKHTTPLGFNFPPYSSIADTQ